MLTEDTVASQTQCQDVNLNQESEVSQLQLNVNDAARKEEEKCEFSQSTVKIVIMGVTGAGKSSFANTLQKDPTQLTFKTGSDLEGCTQECQFKIISIFDKNDVKFQLQFVYQVEVLDLPGIGDPQNNDLANTMNSLNAFTKIKSINCFFFVLNGTNLRFDLQVQGTLQTYVNLIGPGFLSHTMFVVTHWPQDSLSQKIRQKKGKTEEMVAKQLNEQIDAFFKSVNLEWVASPQFQVAFIDNYVNDLEDDHLETYDQCSTKSLQNIRDFIQENRSLSCNLRYVHEEIVKDYFEENQGNSQYKDMLRRIKNDLYNLDDIQDRDEQSIKLLIQKRIKEERDKIITQQLDERLYCTKYEAQEKELNINNVQALKKYTMICGTGLAAGLAVATMTGCLIIPTGIAFIASTATAFTVQTIKNNAQKKKIKTSLKELLDQDIINNAKESMKKELIFKGIYLGVNQKYAL